MPDTSGGKVTALTGASLRYKYDPRNPNTSTPGIVTGGPEDWFGPLNPQSPSAPPEVAGRQWNFPSGYNLNIEPRAYEPISFGQLRDLADAYDVLRAIIETRKDQMAKLKWSIKARDLGDGKPAGKEGSPLIQEITQFFEMPDGEQFWDTWLRVLLEDLFVLDAPTLFIERGRGGKMLALQTVDGSTIKRVIDDYGRTPKAPIVAYQQALHGLPAVNYTTRDLIYRPRNQRAHKVYGYGPVEQIVMTINIALRRQAFLLQYYTEGNVPEALIGVPETWSTKQISEFQDWFDTTLSGNTAMRRRARFVPAGVGKTHIATKEGALTDQTDEWLTRVACFAFSISPSAFVKQMNRATSDTAKEQAAEEGLYPIQQWVKQLVDYVIRTEWKTRDVEFGWDLDDDTDPKVQMDVLTGYVKGGIMSVNEARDRIGEEAVPGGDVVMALSPTGGWEPVDVAETAKRLEAMPLPPAPEPKPGAANGETPPAKPKAKEVGKAADLPLAGQTGASKVADGTIKPGEYTVADATAEETEARARALARVIAQRLEAIGVQVSAQVLDALTQYVVAPAEDEDARLEDYRLLAERIGHNVDLSAFNELVEPVAEALAETTAATTADSLDVFFGGSAPQDITNLVNQGAVAQANARAAELVGMTRNAAGDLIPNPDARYAITDTTRDMLRRTIADGLAQNIGNEAIAKRIQELGFSDDRAKLIAFTEIANANSAAALESMKATRARGSNIKKAWLTAGDDLVEEVCLRNEEAGAIDLDDPFPSGDQHPLAHPRCRCALRAIVTRTW